MSSRLQVGGLALLINSIRIPANIGQTVRLSQYLGTRRFTDGTVLDNVWVIESDDLVDSIGDKSPYLYCESKNLMPLGDKQTQDELRKEQEELTCKN